MSNVMCDGCDCCLAAEAAERERDAASETAVKWLARAQSAEAALRAAEASREVLERALRHAHERRHEHDPDNCWACDDVQELVGTAPSHEESGAPPQAKRFHDEGCAKIRAFSAKGLRTHSERWTAAEGTVCDCGVTGASEPAQEKKHVCGASGFGQPEDVCPGCEAWAQERGGKQVSNVMCDGCDCCREAQAELERLRSALEAAQRESKEANEAASTHWLRVNALEDELHEAQEALSAALRENAELREEREARRAAESRAEAAREALTEAHEFLKHSGNQRAILSGKFTTPSARYDWFQRVKASVVAALAALAAEGERAKPATVKCEKCGVVLRCAACGADCHWCLMGAEHSTTPFCKGAQ